MMWTHEGDCGTRDSWAGIGRRSDGFWVVAWSLDPTWRPETPDDVPETWVVAPVYEQGAEVFRTEWEAQRYVEIMREIAQWAASF